jgi:nickel-type superoxide dismutase maturation protease
MKLRRVSGNSMLPTLKDGQLVLLTRAKSVKIGDVVMVTHDGLEKIKRVSRIENDRVYLLGDNPAASTDSRSFGWVNSSAIAAKLRFSF